MRTSDKLFEKGQQLMIDGKFKESIEVFTDAMKSGLCTDLIYLSRGVAYLKNEETDQAISDFKKALGINKENARAYYYSGVAHLIKEDYRDAINELNESIKIDPENGSAFLARGASYAQIGNDEMAAKNIKTAITFSEANVYSLQETIGLWRTQFDKAISIFSGEKKAPEIKLTDEEFHAVKGWLEESYRSETFH